MDVMQMIIDYFETIPSSQRSLILVSGLTLFWVLEGSVPLFKFNYKKWRHALPNLFFTLTTVIINFILAFLLLNSADWVVANQFGSWPYGRAGWCAGQDVKQWTYDITDWVDFNATNELLYRGLYNGQEYQPTGETQTGGRNIHAEIWVVFYSNSIIE